MNKNFLALIFILIIFSALFLKVRASLPVVRADGVTLSREDFADKRAGFLRFAELNREKLTAGEIERGIALAFIEESLIRNEIEKRGKRDDDIVRAVEEGVRGADLEKLESATIQIYGWNRFQFEKFVLYPQARRNILMAEFEKDKIDMGEWLEKSLDEANISIYLLKWKWKDGDVKERF